ncbi:MAG: hypothetical protein EP335_12010 [Alphaproteobacteria bacterium]|nr:MAG: hypothetical protein EP335_12010 [Alphaproteobacteria bacterium]
MAAGTGINDAVVAMESGTQLGLTIALAFMMFSVALGLRTSDFGFLKTHPRSMAVGLLAQIVGLPLVTLALILLLNPAPGIALGMLVVACCPGGNVSNLYTRLSGGNTAYSVALTTCSSLFSAAALPLAILFWTGLYGPTRDLVKTIDVDRAAFIAQTSTTLLLPLLAGIAVAHFMPALARRLLKICLPLAVLLLLALVVVGITRNMDLLADFGATILPIVILHNAAAFLTGSLTGRLFLNNRAKARALTFEVGIQNSGLGLLIILSQFKGLGSAALILATWSVWHLIGGFVLTGFLRIKDAQDGAPPTNRYGGNLMAYDLIIKGGSIYDGNGGDAFTADVAIKDGIIAAVGDISDSAARMIDATSHIVTPGFLDLHTHYDGQVSWDADMQPSVNHGVTTAVMGSCGVGFAPVHENDRDRLVRLMEGVEDIPGTALAEGLTWNWESFPDYMNAIDFPHAIDFATQVVHDPLRVYVMGDRALYNEKATPDDIAKMRDLTRAALQAGAVGFSTGRSDVHRTADGDWTPASEATREELAGIAEAFRDVDHGVLQAVNDFDLERGDETAFDREFDLLEAFAGAAGGKPFSLSLMQRDFAPNQWKKIMARAEAARDKGINMRLQVAPRGIGVILGLQCTFHPFIGFPSYKKISHLPLSERVAIMRDPDFKARLLTETSEKMAGDGTAIPPIADLLLAQIDFISCKMFKLGENPDYEQPVSQSVYKMAEAEGQKPLGKIYDILLEKDGEEFIYFPIYNYTNLNYDAVHTMMSHPQSIMGLSDGGAHVGTVCDASFPTYLLSYWARDRKAGAQIPLARAVKMLTSDIADYVGFHDRGRIAVGQKANINVIDHKNLRLYAPHMVKDLPAGGQRLLQAAKGYVATIVGGVPVVENDQLTGALPGRLVRLGQAA